MVVPSTKVAMRSLRPSLSTSATLSFVIRSKVGHLPTVPGANTSRAGGGFSNSNLTPPVKMMTSLGGELGGAKSPTTRLPVGKSPDVGEP